MLKLDGLPDCDESYKSGMSADELASTICLQPGSDDDDDGHGRGRASQKERRQSGLRRKERGAG